MSKHRSRYRWDDHYTHRWGTFGHYFGWSTRYSWLEAFRYQPRHRGVYDWFIGTSLGRRRMGELFIKIEADLKGFDRKLVEALRTPGFLGTKPDAPWVVWRE